MSINKKKKLCIIKVKSCHYYGLSVSWVMDKPAAGL